MSIEQLATDLAIARNEEALAKSKRIQCEEAILAQFELGESGSHTVKTNNGLKLTIKTSLGYKIERGAVLPDSLLKRTEKIELNAKAYESLRAEDPMGFALIAENVTTTPRKPSVTLAVL